MTLNLDLSSEAYLYAQALDNLGASEYWCISGVESIFVRLPSDDARLSIIRREIDRLQQSGRRWSIAGGHWVCRVTWSGSCVITVHPITYDVDGRLSPVLLLFNVFAPARVLGVLALAGISSHLKRNLVSQDDKALARLEKLLRGSRWLLFIHILLFSRSLKND